MLRFENIGFCYHGESELVESQNTIREMKVENISDIHMRENVIWNRTVVQAISKGAHFVLCKLHN